MSYELRWCYVPRAEWSPPPDSSAIAWGLRDPATSYFCITIGVMGHLLTLMDERSMLSFGEPPPPPDPADYGITNPPYPGTTDFQIHPDPALEAFEDAYWAVLQARLHEPGIACYKLCSNACWWVSPDEITEALARCEQCAAPDDPLWHDWLAYLRGAAEHGGFTVL